MRKLVIGTLAARLFPLMVPKTESCNAFEGEAIARSRAWRIGLSNTAGAGNAHRAACLASFESWCVRTRLNAIEAD
jgi:hypothetical protein